MAFPCRTMFYRSRERFIQVVNDSYLLLVIPGSVGAYRSRERFIQAVLYDTRVLLLVIPGSGGAYESSEWFI